MDKQTRDEEVRSLREEIARLRSAIDRIAARVDAMEGVEKTETHAPALPKMSAPGAPAEIKKRKSTLPPPPPKPVSKEVQEAFIPSPPAPAPAVKKEAPRRDWEKWIGTYLAPRIGALFVVTAGVLLLSMAANQLGAAGRVGIGYGASVVLIALGFWQERRYTPYGRVLIGAGFSLAYFVSYAAHYISFAQIFEAKLPSWILMGAVVAAWAGIAIWRQSTIMASVVVVLGHLTIILTGPAAESVVAIVFIAAGCAVMLARYRWTVVAGIGVIASYLTYFLWIANSESSGALGEYYTAMAFLAAIFASFALGDFFGPRGNKEDRIDSRVRSAILSLNSAAFLVLGTILTQNGPFDDPPVDQFFLIASLPLLLLGIGQLRLRGSDPLFNLYITKGVAVATLGVAIYVDRDARTAAWAVETAVLWMSARRSGLVVTRLLGMALAALTLVSALGAFNGHPQVIYTNDGAAGAIAAGVIAWLAWWVAAWIQDKTPWTDRTPDRIPMFANAQDVLYAIGIVSKPPEKMSFEYGMGSLVRMAFGLGGALLTLLIAGTVLETPDVSVTIAAIALVTAMAAGVLGMRSLDIASILCALVAPLAFLHATGTGIIRFDVLMLLGAAWLWAGCLLAEERITGPRGGWYFRRWRFMPVLLYASATVVLATAVLSFNDEIWGVMALAILAYALAVSTRLLNETGLKTAALILLFIAMAGVLTIGPSQNDFAWYATALIVIAYPFVAQEYFVRTGALSTNIPTQIAYVFGAIVLTARFVPEAIVERWWPAAWVVAAGIVFLAGARQHIVMARIGALLTLALATFTSMAISLDGDPTALSHVAAFVSVAAMWTALSIAIGRRPEESRLRKWQRVPLAVGALWSVFLVGYYPGVTPAFIAIGWTLIALGWFGLSIPLKDAYYRYAGMGIFALAIGRVVMIIAPSDLPTIYKVAAAFVLGVVLLAVGWGYYKAQSMLQEKEPTYE